MAGNFGGWVLISRELAVAMKRLEDLISLGGAPLDELPATLRLKDIQLEETLFQPRDSLTERHYKRDSERHVDDNRESSETCDGLSSSTALGRPIVVKASTMNACKCGHFREAVSKARSCGIVSFGRFTESLVLRSSKMNGTEVTSPRLYAKFKDARHTVKIRVI